MCWPVLKTKPLPLTKLRAYRNVIKASSIVRGVGMPRARTATNAIMIGHTARQRGGISAIIGLAAGVVPFNADEAIVGLMARHILQGERPVFFYGQAYLGSLDAWLVAGAFAIFGESVWPIRLVQIVL